MSTSSSLARCGAAVRFLLIAGAIVFVACSQEIPPRSALELMRDPSVRDAVLLRCNQLQGAALRDTECRNVREAVDRLAAEHESQAPEQVQQDSDDSFEKARAERRAHDERERRRREANEKPSNVDPYTMPLVPEQPATPATPTAAVMSAVSLPEA
jgi:hypothetical protein